MAWWEWAINIAMWGWVLWDLNGIARAVDLVDTGSGQGLHDLRQRVEELERQLRQRR